MYWKHISQRCVPRSVYRRALRVVYLMFCNNTPFSLGRTQSFFMLLKQRFLSESERSFSRKSFYRPVKGGNRSTFPGKSFRRKIFLKHKHSQTQTRKHQYKNSQTQEHRHTKTQTRKHNIRNKQTSTQKHKNKTNNKNKHKNSETQTQNRRSHHPSIVEGRSTQCCPTLMSAVFFLVNCCAHRDDCDGEIGTM